MLAALAVAPLATAVPGPDAPARPEARSQATRQAAPVAFPYLNDFKASTSDTVLTGNAKYDDKDPDGWLRLTTTDKDQSGSWQMNRDFSTNLGVVAEFTYATYGGNNHCPWIGSCNGFGDGLTMYLADGTAPNGVGNSGGALGYVGVPGAFLGVGFDEYGNFSNEYGGPGKKPDNIVLRGGGTKVDGKLTGYTYATGVKGPGDTVMTKDGRKQFRTARVSVVPKDGKLLVSVSSNTGPGTPMQQMIDSFNISTVANQPALPETLKLGFSAGTGGATNNHEIGDLKVALPVDLSLTKTAPATAEGGKKLTYTLTVKNDESNDVAGARIKDTVPAALTNVTWNCEASAGSSCGAATGSGNALDTTADLKRGGTATYTLTTDTPLQPQVVTNSATVTAPTALVDIDESNNAAKATVGISASTTPQGSCHTYTYIATGTAPTKLLRVNPLTGKTTDTGIEYKGGFDAMGYSPLTDRLYAITRESPFRMMTINPNTPDGDIKVQDVPGLENNSYWQEGDIGVDGRTFYVAGAGSYKGLAIDVTAPKPVGRASKFNVRGSKWYDWALHPKDGRLYMADSYDLKSVDFAGDQEPQLLVNGKIPSGDYLSTFFDEVGNFYAIEKGGKVYQVDLSASTAEAPIKGNQVREAVLVSTITGQSDVRDAAGCVINKDFGDAPDSYHTTADNAGPFSDVDESLSLGKAKSVESDARRPIGTNGQAADYNGLGDQDDAFTALPVINEQTYGLTVPLTNTDSQRTATVAAWIDFDHNGVFDNGERATAVVPAGATSAELNWNVPDGIAPGGTFARIRLYEGAVGTPLPTGEYKKAGEVEDYPVKVELLQSDLDLTKTSS